MRIACLNGCAHHSELRGANLEVCLFCSKTILSHKKEPFASVIHVFMCSISVSTSHDEGLLGIRCRQRLKGRHSKFGRTGMLRALGLEDVKHSDLDAQHPNAEAFRPFLDPSISGIFLLFHQFIGEIERIERSAVIWLHHQLAHVAPIVTCFSYNDVSTGEVQESDDDASCPQLLRSAIWETSPLFEPPPPPVSLLIFAQMMKT